MSHTFSIVFKVENLTSDEALELGNTLEEEAESLIGDSDVVHVLGCLVREVK